MSSEYLDLNLADSLGAEKSTSIDQLSLYIPNKDKDGNEIPDIITWINNARKILTLIGGGATTMPPTDGSWMKSKIAVTFDEVADLTTFLNKFQDDFVIWEQTTVIYTFIDADKLVQHINILRDFLHKFGRETKQGEVVFDFNGEFFRISKYDS